MRERLRQHPRFRFYRPSGTLIRNQSDRTLLASLGVMRGIGSGSRGLKAVFPRAVA